MCCQLVGCRHSPFQTGFVGIHFTTVFNEMLALNKINHGNTKGVFSSPDGRADGWSVRRAAGRKDGRTDGRTDRWADGRLVGSSGRQTDGGTDGWTDGPTDGRAGGLTDGRKKKFGMTLLNVVNRTRTGVFNVIWP